MSSFRFLHAADIHLDSPLSGLDRYDNLPQDDIRHASRRALENLVALAIQEKVAFVLLAGDLYDGQWRDSHTGLFMVRMLTKLTKAGIEVFSLSGNHDAESIIRRSFPMPEGVHHFSSRKAETCLLEKWKVALHGRSFPERKVPDDFSDTYPMAKEGYLNIGLLHTSLEGASDGHDCYAPCTLDGLNAKEYDYWALGHVHSAKIVQKSPSWVVYPGVLQGRHSRETGACGAMIVDVEDGHINHVTPIACDVLRWEHVSVDLTDTEELTDIEERVKHALSDIVQHHPNHSLIVRLFLRGPTALHGVLCGGMRWKDHLHALTAHFTDDERFLGIEKIINDTTPPPQQTSHLHNDSLNRAFHDAMNDLSCTKEEDKEFRSFLNTLPDELKDALPLPDDPHTLEQARHALTARLKGETL